MDGGGVWGERAVTGAAEMARLRLVVVLTLLALVSLAALPTAASAAARTGTLSVRVSALPPGQAPSGLLLGPGMRRRVSASRLMIRGARPGLYRLVLATVKLTRSAGPLKRGALAYPAGGVRVRLRAGASATLRGRYGTIINPGVVSLAGSVISVGGDRSNPSFIVLGGRRSFAVGAVLSMAPSATLPRGLLAHVRSVRHAGGRTTVLLAPASVYEVMPVAQFDIPLRQSSAAHASSARIAARKASCTGVSGVSLSREITNIRFSGGWNTVRFLGRDITIGVRAHVDFDAAARVDIVAGIGVDCSLQASYSQDGMIGPIPVTVAISGELDASASAAAKLSTGGSVHVSVGADTVGAPPALIWLPQVRFSDPRFTFDAGAAAQASAGISVGVEAGLGEHNTASATLDFTNSVTFTGTPTTCSWDADFGQFDAKGKLLGWTIKTPQTPPLFHVNLYKCGGGGGPPSVSVVNPGDQVGSVDLPVALRIQASASDGGRLAYSAVGLPPGLGIDPSTGVISGIPKTPPGIHTVGVTVTDSGPSDSVTFNWAITPAGAQPAVIVTNPGDQTGTVGDTANLQIQAATSDRFGALRYSESGLPPDVSINQTTGLISGPLNAAGTFPVTITAADVNGGTSGSTSFTWTIGTAGGPDGGPVGTITPLPSPEDASTVGWSANGRYHLLWEPTVPGCQAGCAGSYTLVDSVSGSSQQLALPGTTFDYDFPSRVADNGTVAADGPGPDGVGLYVQSPGQASATLAFSYPQLRPGISFSYALSEDGSTLVYLADRGDSATNDTLRDLHVHDIASGADSVVRTWSYLNTPNGALIPSSVPSVDAGGTEALLWGCEQSAAGPHSPCSYVLIGLSNPNALVPIQAPGDDGSSLRSVVGAMSPDGSTAILDQVDSNDVLQATYIYRRGAPLTPGPTVNGQPCEPTIAASGAGLGADDRGITPGVSQTGHFYVCSVTDLTANPLDSSLYLLNTQTGHLSLIAGPIVGGDGFIADWVADDGTSVAYERIASPPQPHEYRWNGPAP